MKDNFELPEKWWVQSTAKRGKVIYEWLDKHKQRGDIVYSRDLQISDMTQKVHYPLCNGGHQFIHGQPGYKEITYQQFEEHVLNKPVVRQKENYDYLIPIIEKLNKS